MTTIVMIYLAPVKRMPGGEGRGGTGMRRASIAALKARLSEYVDAAKAGEEVIITDRNKPVARLGPVGAPIRGEARLIGLIRAGVARPPVRALPRGFWRRPRPVDSEARALAALIEDRAEDR